MSDHPARLEAATEGSRDIVARINDACVGHPHAKIPWPHRLLHDARMEIERLRADVRHSDGVAARCTEALFLVEDQVMQADTRSLTLTLLSIEAICAAALRATVG